MAIGNRLMARRAATQTFGFEFNDRIATAAAATSTSAATAKPNRRHQERSWPKEPDSRPKFTLIHESNVDCDWLSFGPLIWSICSHVLGSFFVPTQRLCVSAKRFKVHEASHVKLWPLRAYLQKQQQLRNLQQVPLTPLTCARRLHSDSGFDGECFQWLLLLQLLAMLMLWLMWLLLLLGP